MEKIGLVKMFTLLVAARCDRINFTSLHPTH